MVASFAFMEMFIVMHSKTNFVFDTRHTTQLLNEKCQIDSEVSQKFKSPTASSWVRVASLSLTSLDTCRPKCFHLSISNWFLNYRVS